MYHYIVVDSLSDEIVLDSRRREDFDGYSSKGAAHNVAMYAISENRLDLFTHHIEIIDVLETMAEQELKDACEAHLFAISMGI